jgi:predicted dehydrogenase
MNFGLLCDDPAAAPVLAAIRRSCVHALTHVVLVSPEADRLLHGLAGLQFHSRWEDLLAARNVDAVIVGGSSPDAWDGARRLASEGMPLLVCPTLAQGAAPLYELSLIRDDRQGVLLPVWKHRLDPQLQRLRDQLRSVDRPAISYLQWEHEVGLGVGAEVPGAVMNEELLHAADLLRFLCGAADQVTTLRTAGTSTGALIQSVVLAGRSIPEATWTIRSAARKSSRLTLQTPEGPAILEWHAESDCWIAFSTSPLPAVKEGGAAGNAAERLLDECADAVAGRKTETAWVDVLHAAEIVDAAQRSLARRRTIELHHEGLSERAIFKTQMAAMGCGVLLLTLVLMLGYLVLASVAPLDPRILNVLRVLVFAPLFVFLLLQLLLPLTRTAEEKAP